MRRPSAGHVFGYTALIVILTAGGAQSLSGSNTVFTDDITNGNVTYADIKDSAIGSKKVLNNALTGSDVNEAKLTLTCPSAASNRAGDTCYTNARGPATFSSALDDCVGEALRLPSVAEARLVASDVNLANLLWTDVYYDDGAEKAVLANNTTVDTAAAIIITNQYRCVTTIGARP